MSVIYVPMVRFDNQIYALCNEQAIVAGWRSRYDAKVHYDAEFRQATSFNSDTQLAAFYGETYLRVVPIDDVVLYNLIHTPFLVERVQMTYGYFVGIPLLKDVETAHMLWVTGLPVRGTVNQDTYWRPREALFTSEISGLTPTA